MHRFKSSDWLKGHMTWTVSDNVHVRKLIHVCVFFFFFFFFFYYFPDSLEAVTARKPTFPDFTVRYGLKTISKWGV